MYRKSHEKNHETVIKNSTYLRKARCSGPVYLGVKHVVIQVKVAYMAGSNLSGLKIKWSRSGALALSRFLTRALRKEVTGCSGWL